MSLEPYVYLARWDGALYTAANRLATHYHYSKQTGLVHCHPQFSPDGRYVLFTSDVTNTAAGTPPGGHDHDGDSADLFVVPLDGVPGPGDEPDETGDETTMPAADRFEAEEAEQDPPE